MAINDTNTKILLALNEIGQRVFNSLIGLLPGTYTAKELTITLKDLRNKTGIEQERMNKILDGIKEMPGALEIENVDVETFHCEFPRRNVFDIITRFEALPGAARTARAKFVCTDKTEYAFTFFATFTKDHGKLAKLVSDDERCKQMQLVCLNPGNGHLVATDARELVISPIMIDGLSEDWQNCNLLIDPNSLKNLVGRCKVMFNTPNDFIIENEAGEIYKFGSLNRYPDYMRVLPKVNQYGYIKLSKDGIKQLTSFIKLVAKMAGKSNMAPLTFKVKNGSNAVVVGFEDSDNGNKTSVATLESPAMCELNYTLDANILVKILPLWDGGMWFNGSCRPVVFDGKSISAGLVMPLGGDCRLPNNTVNDIPALERFNILHAHTNVSDNEPRYLPAIYEPSYAVVMDFVAGLCKFVESANEIVKYAIFAEISRQVEKIKELAAVANISVENIMNLFAETRKEEPTKPVETEKKPVETKDIVESVKIRSFVAVSPFVWQILHPTHKSSPQRAVSAKSHTFHPRRPRHYAKAWIKAAICVPGGPFVSADRWICTNNNCRIRDGTNIFSISML